MMEERYDYIICGAGCAGLSLAYYLSQFDLNDKRILLLDKDPKEANDHTWCFWQKENGPFEKIVKSKYTTIQFSASGINDQFNIAPYKYKKIEGVDFYHFVKPILEAHKNFEFIQAEIFDYNEDDSEVQVNTSLGVFKGKQVFKSYLSPDFSFGQEHNVLQHFKGWEIKTEEDCFDEDSAVFMDFRIEQNGEVRFLYVLPKSKTTALVEVAIFSNELLGNEDYDLILKNYIADYLAIEKYKIVSNEFGVIPMTTYPFEKHNSPRIKNIGTAGGWVKASSGFAFDRIQRRAKLLATALTNGKSYESTLSSKNRFRFYDKIFLNVLLSGKATGDQVFGEMFKNLKSELIFKFLDEDTSMLEDLKVFTGPPMRPFVKAFFEEIRK